MKTIEELEQVVGGENLAQFLCSNPGCELSRGRPLVRYAFTKHTCWRCGSPMIKVGGVKP